MTRSRRHCGRAAACALLVPGLLAASVCAAAEAVTLLHLGNAGFLIEGGGSKVLVDGIQGQGVSGYVRLPSTRNQTLQRALPPFDDVDLVLATHRHADHFDPWGAGRFLLASPRALLLSTVQSVERLRQEFPDSERVTARARGFAPVEGRPERLEHAGIAVTILDLHHGRGREVRNLGFVFDVGGLRFLHVGDTAATPEELARYGIGKLEVDVALLPFWIVAGERWPRYREAIGAGTVVAMHVPAADAPARYFARGQTTQAEFLDWMRAHRPAVLLFWEPFQSQRLELGKTPTN